MIEGILLVITGIISLFGAGAVLFGILFQFAANIIWPMVDFILRWFGI